ncbi:[FeFe] hydrogenase, group A [Clostridium gasigenes]|uniref:NADH-dependent [FeFe] hydrogenase, group A6 n=1 Tax=Clostridium gasigenes TaxID=94869 RepID=UPI001C0BC9D9|nr:NADH-dependent [FeFe] hydrogenase, group A6 [Clostridium gasigenes]MBU3087585.1 [FeFe] hydrogenase, group A [Clostridium gasigenes]MBU3131788.1 [FeFe] hydrogenase, group A [Clostridium gasigenes]
MANITINNRKLEVENGSTILESAKKISINIPTLCHMYMIDGKSRNCKGSCRVCVVEVKGRKTLQAACAVEVTDGMVIKTNSTRVIRARKTIVELLLSTHPNDCLKCNKNLNCELQTLAAELGVDRNRFDGENIGCKIDNSSFAIVRDMNKCILCRRCVTACSDVQNINILTPINRGIKTYISNSFNRPITDTACTYCGQCVAVCPTGALMEVENYSEIWPLLEDENKCVVVQIAPAVRVALGEEFGLSPGSITTKKIVGALKSLGFNSVYDTSFAADLTIMEESNEFINRFNGCKNMPLLTSCCPAWINFVEKNYEESINLLSTCKSPQQMFGSIAKEYLPKYLKVKKENLVVVSIMPCIAKKYEAKREEMNNNGTRDVDIVITTRELAKMIKEAGIDFNNIKDEEFDNPLGESTGAAVIFGSSGGVMEAALRTAYEFLTESTLDNIEFKMLRGLDNIKEATVNINGRDINVAAISSLAKAREVMEEIRLGNCKYDFIEVMACPGGCVNGGGQPLIKSNRKVLKKRINAIYNEDSNNEIRRSHENPMIKKIYEELLIEPNSIISHSLLHTVYNSKK